MPSDSKTPDPWCPGPCSTLLWEREAKMTAAAESWTLCASEILTVHTNETHTSLQSSPPEYKNPSVKSLSSSTLLWVRQLQGGDAVKRQRRLPEAWRRPPCSVKASAQSSEASLAHSLPGPQPPSAHHCHTHSPSMPCPLPGRLWRFIYVCVFTFHTPADSS